MLLSSGQSNSAKFECVVKLMFDGNYSTQQTLDEGVEKLRTIYTSFEDVGVKDRSMIWNSCVICLNAVYGMKLTHG
jgi:hypothetical protein